MPVGVGVFSVVHLLMYSIRALQPMETWSNSLLRFCIVEEKQLTTA